MKFVYPLFSHIHIQNADSRETVWEIIEQIYIDLNFEAQLKINALRVMF